MAADPPDEGLGVVAVDKEQLERMNDNGDELDLGRKNWIKIKKELEERKWE